MDRAWSVMSGAGAIEQRGGGDEGERVRASGALTNAVTILSAVVSKEANSGSYDGCCA